MYKIERNAGRLLELELRTPLTAAELDAFGLRLRELVTQGEGRVVIATDLRGATTFAPEVSDRLAALMRADNPRVERSAFLLPAEAVTFGLQVERMIREASSPHRRTFRDPALLCAWLSEVLAEPERARLRARLAVAR